MIAAGIDSGAKNTKAVILKDGQVVGKGLVLTGFDQGQAVEDSLALAMQQAGIARQDIHRVFGTGSGKKAVKIANGSVNEIQAMARGACYFFPKARTVIDVGAEEGRAAKLDEKGKALDFAVNEKCAAGAGGFIETMARALEVGIEEMGSIGLQSDKEIRLNAQCVIFAESEVVGLIHSNVSKPDISKAIHDSIASRIVPMIRRLGITADVVLIGGLGRNPGFLSSLTKQLRLNHVWVPPDPEFGAAVGAAAAASDDLSRFGV